MLWLPLAPPAVAAETFAGRDFYLGDLHVHTGNSQDGGSSDLGVCQAERCGAAAQLAQTARDNGLDFFSVTDHVNGPSVGQRTAFDQLHALVLAADDPAGGFVSVPGAELSLTLPDGHELGHYNLYLFGEQQQLAGFGWDDARISCDSEVIDGCEVLGDFMAQLTARFGPALLVPHHPAGVQPMPVDWSCTGGGWSPAVEIYSEHGAALSANDPYDPPWSGVLEGSTVHSALGERGLRLGFFASTDTHDTLPGDVCTAGVDLKNGQPKYGGGLAVVVLEQGEPFDRGAVYRALVERRTYATSGPLIPAVVRYSVEGEEVGGMGEGFAVEGPLTAEVSVPAELAPYVLSAALETLDGAVPMDAEGEGVWGLTLGEAPGVFYPALTVDGAAWYGAAGCDDGGEDALEKIWLSPSWSEPAPVAWPEPGEDPGEPWGEACPEDATGRCGCGHGGGGGLWLTATLLLALRRRGSRQGVCR